MTWLYVQSEQDTTAALRAELVWVLPEGLVSVDPLPGAVTLTLRGTRAATRRGRAGELRIPVDIASLRAGEHALELGSYPVSGLPPGLTLLGMSPSSTRFTLDERIERKVVLKPAIIGDAAIGFRLERATVSPSVLTLRGPRSRLVRLPEVSTVPIDISGIAVSDVVPVQVDLPRGVTLAETVEPTADLLVTRLTERRTMVDVPVFVWDQSGFRVEPDRVTVSVSGPSGLVRDLQPTDIAAFAHLPSDPKRSRFEVPFGAQDEIRLTVLTAGSAEVEILEVQPSRVLVYRP